VRAKLKERLSVASLLQKSINKLAFVFAFVALRDRLHRLNDRFVPSVSESIHA
jgi:hypothetical protein